MSEIEILEEILQIGLASEIIAQRGKLSSKKLDYVSALQSAISSVRELQAIKERGMLPDDLEGRILNIIHKEEFRSRGCEYCSSEDNVYIHENNWEKLAKAIAQELRRKDAER